MRFFKNTKKTLTMYYETLLHTLPNGIKAKFTIRNRIIEDKLYFYANFINVELSEYTMLSVPEQKECLGLEITDGNQHSINYSDAENLKRDILSKYGNEYLKTER